jgi:hypothetical protein
MRDSSLVNKQRVSVLVKMVDILMDVDIGKMSDTIGEEVT